MSLYIERMAEQIEGSHYIAVPFMCISTMIPFCQSHWTVHSKGPCIPNKLLAQILKVEQGLGIDRKEKK